MKKPYNFQEYELVNDTSKSNIIFNITVVLIIIMIFYYMCFFNFRVYNKFYLVKNDNYYSILINTDDIDKIRNSKYIFINNKKYNFNINRVGEEYTVINNVLYQNIYISIDSFNYDLNTCVGYFIYSNETLLDYIIKALNGGFGS